MPGSAVNKVQVPDQSEWMSPLRPPRVHEDTGHFAGR